MLLQYQKEAEITSAFVDRNDYLTLCLGEGWNTKYHELFDVLAVQEDQLDDLMAQEQMMRKIYEKECMVFGWRKPPVRQTLVTAQVDYLLRKRQIAAKYAGKALV